MNNTTTATHGTRSRLFKDGTHKHGGTIFATNLYFDDSYAGREYVGCVARQKDDIVNGFSYRWNGEWVEVAGVGENARYLCNVWIRKDGNGHSEVYYFKTRKQAITWLECAADIAFGLSDGRSI